MEKLKWMVLIMAMLLLCGCYGKSDRVNWHTTSTDTTTTAAYTRAETVTAKSEETSVQKESQETSIPTQTTVCSTSPAQTDTSKQTETALTTVAALQEETPGTTKKKQPDEGKKDDTDQQGETWWITGSEVNLRKGPGTGYIAMKVLTKGTRILKIDEEGEWLYVKVGEIMGYIHEDYASDQEVKATVPAGRVHIIVNKSQRRLELKQGESVIGSYSIGLGWNPEGHKQVEGDGRTPEGEYYVCTKNSASSYYLSLGVSYPNKQDAAAALEDGRIDEATYREIADAIDSGRRPNWNTALGGAIMIHGCGGASDWTAGCIAVENEVMDTLFKYCTTGTRITILP